MLISFKPSFSKDSGPGLSNANIIHQAPPQPQVNLRGHGVKSSFLSANYAPPINTTHGAVKEERNNLHIATHESVAASNILPSALHKSVVERNVQPTTSYESGIHEESDALPIITHTSSVKNATQQQGKNIIWFWFLKKKIYIYTVERCPDRFFSNLS